MCVYICTCGGLVTKLYLTIVIPWTLALQATLSMEYSRQKYWSPALQAESLGFPGGSDSKEFTCNAGDLGSIPGLGRFPGELNGYPLQYSGREISMDCIVHGVTTEQLSLHFRFFTD